VLEQLIDIAARNTDAPVLLQGETGTGKGFVARMIHDRSSQRTKPFVEINCASLTPTFFESELFGHERGAFTDARTAKRGLLEIAGEGTVFLDEIAEMSLDVQPRLLKVLEERTFRRLGGTIPLRSNARLIVATNQPLGDAVAERRFRADLYYRLHVLTLTLPALRDRSHDIVPLAHTFLPRGSTLSEAAETELLRYQWPGNIRELKNAIWRAGLLADGKVILPQHLRLSASELSSSPEIAPSSTPAASSMLDLELDAIRRTLARTRGNRSKAARELGIARSTLLEKIKKHSI
jgi:transcriptional regulator with PAS, ATPase and Fis domain